MSPFRHRNDPTLLMQRAARLLAVVLAVGGLAAACVPVAPPPPPPPPQPVSQYCHGFTPHSAGTYQSAFDLLRRTYTEWATADGAVPVQLTWGRTLWLFGDTATGSVSPNGDISPPNQLVSNSAVLQTGQCFQPLMGGVPLGRGPWIGDPGAGQAYWPASAVVDVASDRVYVFLLHVQRPLNVLGTRIAIFSLWSLQLLGITGTLPGTSSLRPYGSTAFSDGAYAYMYSSNSQNFHVARALLADVPNQSKWQYWTGPGPGPGPDDDTWSSPGVYGAAQRLTFVNTPDASGVSLDAPIAPLRVARYGNGYLGTAMLIDAYSSTVASFTAPTPSGPWTYAGVLAFTPAGFPSYGAQTLFNLQGGTPPIVAFSTNLDPPTNFTRYGFRFVSASLPAAPTAIAEIPATTLPPSTEPPTADTTTSTVAPSSTTTPP